MNNIRIVKLKRNTMSSLVFQVTTMLSGFVLPRLILETYGSSVNGIVNSVAQYLQIIAFLELGVGAVIQSSLYRPLAENDGKKISEILSSGEKFFRKIATVLVVYIIILLFIYPRIVKSQFDVLFTISLILAMGISYFSQYYFGVIDRLLLTADQRGYIQYNAQTITLVANMFASIILMKCGVSIQIVKLTTSLLYLVRPIFLRLYVNKHYNVNRKQKYDKEPIEQKWNGFAQHIAAVVLDSTDNIVLTIFSTLQNVSIYSVYHLVVYGLKTLFLSLTGGIQSLMGELWAKDEKEKLEVVFSNYEWLVHTITTLLFGCTSILIVPFVQVYTKGITDSNYIQTLFGFILTYANAGHCLRLPYNHMILAAGHYKQTQYNYIIAMMMNIIISCLTVIKFGLIGVAIGTLIAMMYQTVWMAIYVLRKLLKFNVFLFVKQILVDAIIILLSTKISKWLTLGSVTIWNWILLGFKTVAIWSIVSGLLNAIFYREKIKSVILFILKNKKLRSEKQ